MKSKRGLFSSAGIFLTLMVTLLCLAFGLFAQFYGLDGPSKQSGETRAAPIISALEGYKKETGTYPAELNSLVPAYLSSTPRPAWRWPYAFEYEVRENGNEFVLLFAAGRNMDGDYCSYSSEAKEWTCADSMRPY